VQNDEIVPEKLIVEPAGQVSTEAIMADQAARGEYKSPREILREKNVKRQKTRPDRSNLPSAPGARYENRFPYPEKGDEQRIAADEQMLAPQTLGVQFTGVNGPSETGAFPPDTTMSVGPTQVAVFVNGRLRTFNKTTGVADGALNVDTDVFFASVISTPGAGQVAFTSDPNARYDRNSNRWFLNIIDVVLNSSTGATPVPNRVITAVSDAARNGVISASTVWTFYQFQGDAALFTDYPSFGIDQDAIYIGANMFTLAGAFNSAKGYVIPKAPFLAGNALVVWAFPGMVATGGGPGPFSPRGVDNPDPSNTGPTATGYFIGVDFVNFNLLMVRRVTNPGNLVSAPTMSANISVGTPLTTRFPVKVPHLGNTGGTNGRLDALDDRLFLATMRKNRLWTAHNIGVNNTGVAGATNNRNAARWYELNMATATPTIVQSGTVYDNNATNDANQRNYWIPSIAVSGQGHAALGSSIAGTNERINAFTTGRLAGDALGLLRDGPGGASLPGYTASSTAYNPPGDPGGSSGRRWGDYSWTGVDPLNDMTLWTIQQFNNGTNTYGVRVAQLIAPPPPPTNVPGSTITQGDASEDIIVTGAAPAGQGFYDPGPDPPPPHHPFSHVTASGAGIVVNSVTYNTPTQVTLNLNAATSTPGLKTVTITNPDGQSATVQISVVAAPASPTPTATATVAPTPTATATVAPTPTATATVAPTPTATATIAPTPTATATIAPTPTATATTAPTPTATATVAPTPTATATVAPTPTATATVVPPVAISGTVSYGTAPIGQARFVPGVLLTAAGVVPLSTSTDSFGAYLLNGLGVGPYTVTPSKFGDVNGSISGLDAARVAQHVAGLINLTANQQIAGDATNNGSLSGLDAARIAQFAAGLTNPGIAGQWKFVPSSNIYASVPSSLSGQNFEAILVGDVTGNWVPAAPRFAGASESPQTRPPDVAASPRVSPPLGSSVRLTLPSDVAGPGAGKTVRVPISITGTTGKGIVAYDFTLLYDASVLVPDLTFNWSEKTVSDGWSIVTNTDVPGQIKISAYGTAALSRSGALLRIVFRAVGNSAIRTELKWTNFDLNEGQIPVTLPDGKVSATPASAFSPRGFAINGLLTDAAFFGREPKLWILSR
jgi:hypothetical protein